MKWVLILISITSYQLAFAQEADSLTYPYTIAGTIYDQDGNPLPGINILSRGDGNNQVSKIDGTYYAYIYSPKTAVVFTYYGYEADFYCPDGRLKVDIVLYPDERSWLTRRIQRIGNLFKSKKKSKFLCD